MVICRIGSLESEGINIRQNTGVICRIGSLEKLAALQYKIIMVICRIGSLEIGFSFQIQTS